MSKHRHEKCCPMPMYNYRAMGAQGQGYVAYGGGDYGSWYIRWFYALLLLIVIVLQFGRKDRCKEQLTDSCGDDGVGVENYGGYRDNGQLIDSSVLFIIVIFLLVLCTGCWSGGYGGGSGY